jgi:hypothetical protein
MTDVQEVPTRSPRFRRFRLITNDDRGQSPARAAPEASAPKLVLLSPASTRWAASLADALGPSYRVATDAYETPAAVVIDSRDDDLVRLVQEQRSSTRIVVVHTGHPSEQAMTPAELLDLGADAYLAPASLPLLAAHLKALTRSWAEFPPRDERHDERHDERPAAQTA